MNKSSAPLAIVLSTSAVAFQLGLMPFAHSADLVLPGTIPRESIEKLATSCTQGLEIVASGAVGSFGDQVAREIERSINVSTFQKPKTMVINKSGAAGALAFSHMQLSKNPCVILLSINSLVTLNPLLLKLPSDPINDLGLMLEMMGNSSQILMVNSQSKFTSPEVLLAAIAKREDLAYSSTGMGSAASHIPSELIARDLGSSLTHIPTRGGIEPLRLLQQKQVDFTIALPSVAEPILKTGEIRMLAHTKSGEALVGGVKVPSLIDAAKKMGLVLPMLEANPLTPWLAVWARKSVPTEIQKHIYAVLLAVRSNPEISKLANFNSQVVPSGMTQNRNLRDERQFAEKIVKLLDLKAQ